MAWFSAIGLFRNTWADPRRIPQYEERVAMVFAANRHDAEIAFLNEFRRCAAEDEGVTFLEKWTLEEVPDPPGETVVEVASLTRVSALPPEDYVSAYWSDLRPISCDTLGWRHVWYNKDDTTSGCYNCQESRVGRLWETK